VFKDGERQAADFQPLLNEILERTGLPIALDGIYRWVAFLPSRVDRRVPVPNRYFGLFQDGSFKLRGIEVRRHDTPVFIKDVQMEMLELMGKTSYPVNSLPAQVTLLRRRLSELRSASVPLERLLVTQTLSRTLDEYRSPSPVALAVGQLVACGKTMRPGQRVRFLFTRGKPGVQAWDAPATGPVIPDLGRYVTLLVRAASSIVGPVGVDEQTLRWWLFSNAGYGSRPGVLPPAPVTRQSTLSLPMWMALPSQVGD
ncbi:MAG TPA: DNA polymerase domain-containing protein, partial [Anaerolineales bacterium]|nr:DNA polymerase domain-containing protein [Anaerolineales bacterium]